jgi:ubiquinone/menaquinone biosynthesis C-methylase UbiE
MQRFDREASTFDQLPHRAKLAGEITQAMVEEFRPGSECDVLDFGCGTGLVTLGLQPFVRTILGVDSSAGMLDELALKIADRRIANVSTRCAEVEKGDVLEGSYHLVVTSMTLHHVPQIEPLLRQFFRILRPGGRVGIADLDLDDGLFHADNEGVYHAGFAHAALRMKMEEVGFVDVRFRRAAEVVKPVPSGASRAFTIFLLSAAKPA